MKRKLTACLLLALAAACRAPLAPRLMTPAELQSLPVRAADQRIAYGPDAEQFGELRVPAGTGPHPVVVLIHGGCWKAAYATLRDLGPMGDALKDDGVASWNVEYRRLGQAGGGYSGTYRDVGAALDHLRVLAPQYNLDLGRVVVVGHSAGGHLAMWTALRGRLGPASQLFTPDPLRPRGVVNLAGTIEMAENIPNMEKACNDSVVEQMMDGPPARQAARYAEVSAVSHLPLGVPQTLVWGEHEEYLPRPLAERYVERAARAGDAVRLEVVPGAGHFETASPFAASWPTVRAAIRALLEGSAAR